jgi:inorganic triphosphatase YgiF
MRQQHTLHLRQTAQLRGRTSGNSVKVRALDELDAPNQRPLRRLRAALTARKCAVFVQVHASSTGVLQKLARVFKEKASQDLQRIVAGTSKTREKLGVVEELFTYWVLEDADQELEELEDALIVS